MDGSAFRGIGEMMVVLFWIACLAVPLAIWKIVECIIWLCHHIHVVWS